MSVVQTVMMAASKSPTKARLIRMPVRLSSHAGTVPATA